MALRRAGIDAAVYEAYPATADGVGGSLAIAQRARRAADHRCRGRRAGRRRPISRMAMAVGTRRFLNQPGLPGLPPLQLLWRADLHRALHDRAVAQGIRSPTASAWWTPRRPYPASPRASPTARASADVLIGADGIHSTVRTLIDPDALTRNTPACWASRPSPTKVPAEPDTITFVFGKRGYYLYRPRPGGGTEWGANLPQDRPMSLAEARQVPAADWLRILREAYVDDVPGHQLIRHTSADRLQVLGSLRIMPSLPHWHRGRMVLVGDAAHAPSNTSGQGASLAIESAVQLARCLRDLPDATSAFAAYERLRRARVEQIAPVPRGSTAPRLPARWSGC